MSKHPLWRLEVGQKDIVLYSVRLSLSGINHCLLQQLRKVRAAITGYIHAADSRVVVLGMWLRLDINSGSVPRNWANMISAKKLSDWHSIHENRDLFCLLQILLPPPEVSSKKKSPRSSSAECLLKKGVTLSGWFYSFFQFTPGVCSVNFQFHPLLRIPIWEHFGKTKPVGGTFSGTRYLLLLP